MNKKSVYETPQASVVSIQLEGITNASFRNSLSPNMSINNAEDEDWGEWA